MLLSYIKKYKNNRRKAKLTFLFGLKDRFMSEYLWPFVCFLAVRYLWLLWLRKYQKIFYEENNKKMNICKHKRNERRKELKKTHTRRFSNSGIKEAPKMNKTFVSVLVCFFYVAYVWNFLKIPHFFSGYLTEFIFTLNMYFVSLFFLYVLVKYGRQKNKKKT